MKLRRSKVIVFSVICCYNFSWHTQHEISLSYTCICVDKGSFTHWLTYISELGRTLINDQIQYSCTLSNHRFSKYRSFFLVLWFLCMHVMLEKPQSKQPLSWKIHSKLQQDSCVFPAMIINPRVPASEADSVGWKLLLASWLWAYWELKTT